MKTSWLVLKRSLLEGVLALMAGSFALLAVCWPEWLESFGLHLDSGNGALEWAIPVVMALFAVVLGVRAGHRWHVEFAKVVRADNS